jgi:hypothetical protein
LGSSKPIPKRLQLKPEHLAFMNEGVDFTPAKFSTDNLEECIVTSTGHYVITWSLKDVLKGKLFSYQIKKYGDVVVADNFGYGKDDSIIVTLPDDVRMVNRKGMRNLERVIRRGARK